MTAAAPARHPDQPCRIPKGIEIFSRLLRIDPPTDAEFARLGSALMEGDPAMDAVVDAMSAAGMRETRPLFEKALADGIDSVAGAPAAMEQFFRDAERTPDWVDRDQLVLAAQVMQSGGTDGLYIARDVALMGGYLFSGFNQTLLRTGALKKGSNKRFAETSRWALDVISAGGLEVGGAGYRSTIRVRFIHSMVRRHVGGMADWDDDLFGVPVNQTDMAATLVGSLVAPSVGVAGLGLVNSPREYEAVAHLTRYVGWLIGVDDEFLPRDFRDAIRILAHTSAALSTPDETSRQLAMPMFDDPDEWHYDTFPRFRRALARSQHMGIAFAFLGPGALRKLGFSGVAVPWYPPMVIGLNVARSLAAQLPGGRARAARSGERRAESFMTTMAPVPVVVGDSAAAVNAHAHA
ncbi:oxygenase MpaB family protein [Gordonia shandongensis]|uniref:oxygenase MpaB family protein n=1 Tax=Gordonia shandongensis TaxID=376351 RepID=UPI00047A7048|nr:oxygenase MpaB family protein [Gordonia shandongensis]